MSDRKVGWYLIYKDHDKSLVVTRCEKIYSTTEEGASYESVRRWKLKEIVVVEGNNPLSQLTKVEFPHSPRLVYFSKLIIDTTDRGGEPLLSDD